MNRTLAILDFDGTLIKGQSQKMLVEYFYKRGLIGPMKYFLILIWYLGFKLGLISNVRDIAQYAVLSLKGKKISDLDAIFDDFFETVCTKNLHKNSKNLIKILKEYKIRTLLISTAIDPIISRIQKYLQIDEFICTTLESEKGKYTGRILGDPVYGQEKLNISDEYARQNGYINRQVYVFADHGSDIPLLSGFGHPVAVNPWPELLSFSKEHKWPVLYLDNDESFQYFKSHTLS